MEPLTEEHRINIDQSLTDLKRGEEILKRAQQAGLDVEAQVAENASAREKLLGLKRAFFPTGS